MKISRSQFLLGLGAGLSFAQGSDTPIIITDGSLTMDSAVPWSQFTTAGDSRRHPKGNGTVTGIDLTVNGTTQNIAIGGQPCTVTLQYGGTTITVSTAANGRALQVSANNFAGSFHEVTPNQMAHNNPNNKIGAITIRNGNQTAFSGTGNGGTRVVVHYQ